MRKRISKYEKYREDILEGLKHGMTYSQIFDELLDKYDEDMTLSGMVGYIYHCPALSSKVLQGARGERRDSIPRCKGCECFRRYKGNHPNRGYVYTCERSERVISVLQLELSPPWCKKRELV